MERHEHSGNGKTTKIATNYCKYLNYLYICSYTHIRSASSRTSYAHAQTRTHTHAFLVQIARLAMRTHKYTHTYLHIFSVQIARLAMPTHKHKHPQTHIFAAQWTSSRLCKHHDRRMTSSSRRELVVRHR